MLNEEEANRLIGLFGNPLEEWVQGAANPVMDKTGRDTPLIWHPTLTDLHEQVVHRLNPVMVETRLLPGASSPTLSLTLLGPPSRAVANGVSARPAVATPVEQLPTTKPTL